MAGAEVGTVELNDAIFGIEPNQTVVHEVVKNHLANCRQGTQSALTRAEVSGGGKKPWRQKGTGHARQGSTRAPQWTHGGIVFAPKPRELQLRAEQEGQAPGPEVRPLRQGRRGRAWWSDSINMDAIKTKDFRSSSTLCSATARPSWSPPRWTDRGQERPEHPRRRDHHRFQS